MREFVFAGAGGLGLRGYIWGGGHARTLAIVHGYGEHAGRYAAFARWLGERGVNVAAFDLRGHGKSGGPRGHIASFSQYLADLERFLEAVRDHVPGGARFLLGHSLGGLIVARFLGEGGEATGAVLSSPALGLSLRVPLWKRALARAAAVLWPRLSLPSGIPPEALSRDPEVVARYREDPLVHRMATARWFIETLAAQRAALAAAPRITVPLLVIVGGDDPIVSRATIEEFLSRCGSARRELRVYPGHLHEPLNEVGRERVWEEVRRWLEELSGD